MSRPGQWAITASAIIAIALGSLASPAVAVTTPTTVSGSVLDENGQPLRGVQVYVTKTGPKLTFVGTTLSDGTFTTDRHSTLTAGTQNIVYIDGAEQYVSVTQPVALQVGANVRPAVQLARGATVEGTITTPSGVPLQGVNVVVARNNTDPLDFDYIQKTTRLNGTFDGGAIGSGTFHAYVGTDGHHASRATVEVPAYPGPDEPWPPVQVAVTNVRVPAKPVLTGVFTGRRSVKLYAKVSPTYNIAKLGTGAKVTFYDGSRIIRKNFTLGSSGQTAIPVTGLAYGTHLFKIKFLGTQDVAPTWSPILKARVR